MQVKYYGVLLDTSTITNLFHSAKRTEIETRVDRRSDKQNAQTFHKIGLKTKTEHVEFNCNKYLAHVLCKQRLYHNNKLKKKNE